MQNLEKCIDKLLDKKTVQNIIVKVGQGNNVLCEIKKSAGQRTLTDKTLFDMASVTKIVATTSLTLIAIDRGLLSLSDHVDKFFATPKDKQAITIQHLLTHTMGIGHKSLLGATSYDDIQNYILNIPLDIPIGNNVLYSCPAFILLGRILEKVFNDKLDTLFEKYVAHPLGMNLTTFLPHPKNDIVNSNLIESEKGLVNDYNCRYLGGVCGNAGLFSNVEDMTTYAKMLFSYGEPLFSKKIFDIATKNHTPNMAESRALGYLYVDERYSQTATLFQKGSIGHCGHTGQSIFACPKTKLYVIILSDATISTLKKYGKENYEEVIGMRHDIHSAIKSDLYPS